MHNGVMPNLMQIQASDTSALKGSTYLSYNNVLLTDVLTESYEVDEVRTPDGAQKLVNHHVIKVIGILNPQVNAWLTSATYPVRSIPFDNSLLPDQIAYVRDQLMQERGLLQWGVGGRVVLESPLVTNRAAPGGAVVNPTYLPCDSFQGPKPLYCVVNKIGGAGLYYVRFAVETWTDACVSVGGANKFIQSHRYSMAHDVDGDTWLTVRQVSGQIKCRPELLQFNNMLGPHQIAFDLHPQLPGFKRQNVKIQATPDGMMLGYSFSDVEVALPLGSLSPALKLQAEFSVGTSVANEGKQAYTSAAVHVTAVGPKNQYRFNLLKQALSVALTKLQKPGLMQITDIQVTYSLDNTSVDLMIKAIWKPVAIGLAGLQLADTGLSAGDDINDLDTALSAYRGIGEAAPGSQPDKAWSPQMPEGGKAGTYLGVCLGTSIINGCFVNGTPLNAVFQTDAAGNVRVAYQDKATNGSLPNPPQAFSSVTNTGLQYGFSVSTVPALTVSTAATGLSSVDLATLGWYEDWQMDVSYRTMHNKAVMPVGIQQSASPGSTAYPAPQVATLGHPYSLKVVEWTVAWIGPNPASIILPSPDTGDSNDVLLREDITPAVPPICNSTSKAWRVSGTYWYLTKDLHTSSAQVRSQYSGVDAGFAVGKMMYDPSARAANTISQSRFVAGYSPSFVG